MKLYLSSYLWGNRPEKLFEMVDPDRKKVGIITNSADQFPEDSINQRLQKDIEFLASHNFEAMRLDLRDYFNAALSEVETVVKSFGLIWVKGANVFVLRRAMRQSGFDEVITKLIKEDAVVYGGYSAGACVMGSTLHGLELVDNAQVSPERYDQATIWEGLGILPYAIAPHYKSDHPESALINEVIDQWDKSKQSYLALSDGEALVIDGDGTTETVVS